MCTSLYSKVFFLPQHAKVQELKKSSHSLWINAATKGSSSGLLAKVLQFSLHTKEEVTSCLSTSGTTQAAQFLLWSISRLLWKIKFESICIKSFKFRLDHVKLKARVVYVYGIKTKSCEELLHRNNLGITRGTRAKYQYVTNLPYQPCFDSHLGCSVRSVHFQIDLLIYLCVVNFYVNSTCVIQKLKQVNKQPTNQ